MLRRTPLRLFSLKNIEAKFSKWPLGGSLSKHVQHYNCATFVATTCINAKQSLGYLWNPSSLLLFPLSKVTLSQHLAIKYNRRIHAGVISVEWNPFIQNQCLFLDLQMFKTISDKYFERLQWYKNWQEKEEQHPQTFLVCIFSVRRRKAT